MKNKMLVIIWNEKKVSWNLGKQVIPVMELIKILTTVINMVVDVALRRKK